MGGAVHGKVRADRAHEKLLALGYTGSERTTPKAQRREPAEVLKPLFAEEVAGRERSALVTRRAAAGFPTGKTFDAWQPDASSIPAPTQQALRTLEWVHRRENLVVCGPSGTGKTFSSLAMMSQAFTGAMAYGSTVNVIDIGLFRQQRRVADRLGDPSRHIDPIPHTLIPGRRERPVTGPLSRQHCSAQS